MGAVSFDLLTEILRFIKILVLDYIRYLLLIYNSKKVLYFLLQKDGFTFAKE